MAPRLTRTISKPEDDNDLGNATVLLKHPVRRYVLEHVMTHGQVTSRDVQREFAYLPYLHNVWLTVRPLIESGVLVKCSSHEPGRPSNDVYVLGDLAPLHALHAYLTALLSPTPDSKSQTPLEVSRDEPQPE